MNSTLNFYKGLTNDSTIDDLSITSCTCGAFTVDTVTVKNITASHYYGLLCQVMSTAMFNPEMGFSFDPAVNTFTIYLNDGGIPLSRLASGAYSSVDQALTLVSRDANNSTTMNTLAITGSLSCANGVFLGLLTATANPLSTVSRSNQIQCTSAGAGIFPIMLAGNLTGYITVYSDNLNNLTYIIST